jgi:hypothetical protein
MLGPSSKDGIWESGASVTCDGRVGRPTVGTTETVVPIVETVLTVGDDERYGGSTIAAAPTVARPPPHTQPTRENAPSRNRTEEVATTEPPSKSRKTKSTTTCCDCTRHSTCTSLGAKSRPGCACLLARRNCSGCACFRQCRNKRPNLPEAANDRQLGSTLRAYFPSSQAADTGSTGGLLTQPPFPAAMMPLEPQPTGRSPYPRQERRRQQRPPRATTTTKPTTMMPQRPSRQPSQDPSLRT